MIISKSPVRVSLLGGGTDFENSIEAGQPGIVIAGAIDKYSYITCRYLPRFFDHLSYISYSETEKVTDNSEIKHRVINAVLKFFKIEEGIELSHLADLPGRSGTGSSSTFLIGLINACSTLKGTLLTEDQLVRIAYYIEKDQLRENIGLQDPVTAAFGGINVIRFATNRNFKVEKLQLTAHEKENLESHLMLFFTGINRTSSTVTASYIDKLPRKLDDQKRMAELAEKGLELVRSRNFLRLGKLINASWLIKRELSPLVSNDVVDKMYGRAIMAGAEGGKLIGAGSGGCLLLVVRPDLRGAVRSALSEFIEIPFTFTNYGSRIIIYDK